MKYIRSDQAWDVVVVQPSNWKIQSIEVELPFSTLTGHLTMTKNDNDYFWIDTVFYDQNCDRDLITQSLIEHDGYPSNIKLYRKTEK